MAFDELSPEMKEKARACTTPEDTQVFAREEDGIDLSDEELEWISGGGTPENFRPKCRKHK